MPLEPKRGHPRIPMIGGLFVFFAVREFGCDLSLNSSAIYLCGAIGAAVGVVGAADGAVGRLVAAAFRLGTRGSRYRPTTSHQRNGSRIAT